jgi:uncharacterized membrane protein
MKQSRTLLDRTLVITTLVCLLPLLFSAVVYADLPDQVAIHFNAAGDPDNYAPKAFAAFGLPLLLTLLNVVMQIGLKADPKRDPKERIYHISRWLIAPLNLFLSPLTLLIAMGKPIAVERVVPMGVSILFLIIGNYLPKCKQNYTIGIKLPWTLASQSNWRKTHRFAGWLWTATSIIFIIGLLLNLDAAPLFFVGIPLLVIAPTVYSFLLFRKEQPSDTI